MERLTFDGNFCDIAQCRELPCQHGGSCTQRKVWEKLKAYEDTGLTPEEVNDAAVGSKLLAKSQLVSAFGFAAERLRELAEADKAGRLVACAALDKQIPKKPRETRCALMCANCGHKITEKGCKQLHRNYCKKCGQRILWEDE